MDSTTCARIAIEEGFVPMALTIDYRQRHHREIESARQVARSLGIEKHVVLPIDLGTFGGSALTDRIEVPKNTSPEAIGSSIPPTYVPARNTVFLSLALAMAEAEGVADIFVGVTAVDYSGYPDCRPEYIDAFETMANLGTKAGVEGTLRFRVHTPLIRMSKPQIIRRGTELGIDYRLTHTCYDPDPRGRSCGRCESCCLRRKGFQEAGIEDPTEYVP
jgi:7-cyano-7-deazaguanine synthase